jgi:hypothetical protein
MYICLKRAGYRSRYSDWLRAGRSGDQIPVGARFSAPVLTGPGAHPASCTMGTVYLYKGALYLYHFYIRLNIMYSLFFSSFNGTYMFSTDFRKILKNEIYEDPSVGVHLFHAEGGAGGRTYLTKLIGTFRNFANAPKESMSWTSVCV